jgi:hypothetical protein
MTKLLFVWDAIGSTSRDFVAYLHWLYIDQFTIDLCNRRRWADPLFETHQSRRGWTCRVRVNNREYTCDTAYASEELARDKAAESAYMICRNFSVNDGMYPGQKQGQAGVVQGLPVAIGTGRRSRYKNDYESNSNYSGSSSGDSSPRTSDTELDTSSSRATASTNAVSAGAATVCYCRRAYVSRHSRCEYCMREAGWY